jgi:uncharacterized protein YgbK (DUF1537 family)
MLGMSEPRYASPQALRRAATDRLRELAEERSGARLGDLLPQFAYDRLLARVFTKAVVPGGRMSEHVICRL